MRIFAFFNTAFDRLLERCSLPQGLSHCCAVFTFAQLNYCAVKLNVVFFIHVFVSCGDSQTATWWLIPIVIGCICLALTVLGVTLFCLCHHRVGKGRGSRGLCCPGLNDIESSSGTKDPLVPFTDESIADIVEEYTGSGSG